MSGRNGHDEFAFGGLATGLLVIIVTAVIGLGLTESGLIHAQRERNDSYAAKQCDSANHQGCEELKAQVQSARATEDTVDIAIWQLGFGLVGLAGVGWTVYYAHHAFRQAERQANAAEEVLNSLERPWIVLDGVQITRRKPPDTPNAWFAKPKFKNIGRIPAISEELIMKLGDIDTLPAKPDYSGPFSLATPRYVSAGDGFDVQGPGPGEGAREKDGKAIRYIMYGVLRYRSLTSGRKYETGFSFEVSAHLPAITSYGGDGYDYHT
jgi:hypothetical protein